MSNIIARFGQEAAIIFFSAACSLCQSDLFFPECVARVPGSIWGLGVVFARRCATVRNRSQPFATVRNRPREARMAVAMASFAKGVLEVLNVA